MMHSERCPMTTRCSDRNKSGALKIWDWKMQERKMRDQWCQVWGNKMRYWKMYFYIVCFYFLLLKNKFDLIDLIWFENAGPCRTAFPLQRDNQFHICVCVIDTSSTCGSPVRYIFTQWFHRQSPVHRFYARIMMSHTYKKLRKAVAFT